MLKTNQRQNRATGPYYVLETTGLQSGAGFVEVKVESGLGYSANRGYVINDGPGSMKATITHTSGVTSGQQFTVKANQTFNVDGIVSSFNYSYSGTSGDFRSFWQ